MIYSSFCFPFYLPYFPTLSNQSEGNSNILKNNPGRETHHLTWSTFCYAVCYGSFMMPFSLL